MEYKLSTHWKRDARNQSDQNRMSVSYEDFGSVVFAIEGSMFVLPMGEVDKLKSFLDLCAENHRARQTRP